MPAFFWLAFFSRSPSMISAAALFSHNGTFSPLTREDGEDGYPIWSPDGSRIVFSSTRNGGGLFSRAVSGANGDTLLVPFVLHQHADSGTGAKLSYSAQLHQQPDGRWLVTGLTKPVFGEKVPSEGGEAPSKAPLLRQLDLTHHAVPRRPRYAYRHWQARSLFGLGGARRH